MSFMFGFMKLYTISDSYCPNYNADHLLHFRANHSIRSPFDVIVTATGFSFFLMIFIAHAAVWMSILRAVSNPSGYSVSSGNTLL